MRNCLALIAVAALVAAPALADRKSQRAADIAAGEAELAKATKGLVPGKELSCLPPGRASDGQNIDHVGILYGFGNQKYLSRMDPDCASFRFSDIPVIVSYGGQTCRGDIVRIVDSSSHFPKGSCALGPFIPYRKPKG